MNGFLSSNISHHSLWDVFNLISEYILSESVQKTCLHQHSECFHLHTHTLEHTNSSRRTICNLIYFKRAHLLNYWYERQHVCEATIACIPYSNDMDDEFVLQSSIRRGKTEKSTTYTLASVFATGVWSKVRSLNERAKLVGCARVCRRPRRRQRRRRRVVVDAKRARAFANQFPHRSALIQTSLCLSAYPRCVWHACIFVEQHALVFYSVYSWYNNVEFKWA